MTPRYPIAMLAASAALFCFVGPLSGCGDVIGDAILNPADTETETETAGHRDTDLPERRRVPLSFDATGWIDRDNPLHLQGQWHAFAGTGSSITGVYAANQARVTGWVTSNPEFDPYYLEYWGAKIGFHICSEPPQGDGEPVHATAGACPYNPDLDWQMVGVEVTLEGSLPATELRLQLSEAGRVDGVYSVLDGPGTHTLYFEDARVHYYPDADPFNPEAMDKILFFVSSAGGPAEFDFTISKLALIADF